MAAHAQRTERPIRLLIVDDSLVARTMLARMLGAHPAFEIVGLAARATQALDLLADAAADIVLLDVEMPGTDGLTALPDILARSRGGRVLMLSSATRDGGAATLRALALGAADTLLKPATTDLAGGFADLLVERLLRIGRARGASPAIAPQPRATRQSAARTECVALAASTGGVNALAAFFAALPRHFSVPMLVTQHLPAEFMPFFAAQLAQCAGRSAMIATDGARLRAGEILVAPGGAHIKLVAGESGPRIRLDRTSAGSGCLPSADPMLASLGAVFGSAGMGIILSGMGRDGLVGAGALVQAGGEVMVQDGASSVVWGMPGAIANAGLASAVLPPARLARLVAERAGGRPWT